MAAAPINIGEILKPFYQRASEAEDRLAKLEASVVKNNESGNDEQLKLIGELQSQLERAKAEQLAEREECSIKHEKQKGPSKVGDFNNILYVGKCKK